MAALSVQQQQMNEAIARALQQERALEASEAESNGDNEEEEEEEDRPTDDGTTGGTEGRLLLDGNRTTMNLERRLYSNVCLSPYFKSLAAYGSFEKLYAELAASVKHLGAWCGVSEMEVGEGSPAYCLLLRLHQVGLTAPQLDSLLHDPNAYARSLGLLYVRFTQYRRPALYHRLERHFHDTAHVFLDPRRQEGTTVGEFARDLLRRLRFAGTIFPRMPVETANEVEQLLGERLQDAAPLQAPRGKQRKAEDEDELTARKRSRADSGSSSDSEVPQPRFLAKRRGLTNVPAAPARRSLLSIVDEGTLSFRERWVQREQQRRAGQKPAERSPTPPTPPPSSLDNPGHNRSLNDGALRSQLDAIKKLYGADERVADAETPQQRALNKKALSKKDSLAAEVLRY
eukprot:GGOE01044224.1.p1 GENE.GGOE01044224.1~~GGOE01044224.1.p1  ORF type:complete len:414 (+),score=117.93 GGOE01044224.1:40-1242(+)